MKRVAPESPTALITFDRLWRAYGPNVVLKNFSLAVSPGEVVALLGRNGVGKTTALKTLLGLQRPTSGRCTLLGHDSWSAPVSLRQRVGYMAENNPLEPWMRIRDLVAFTSGFYPRWRTDLVDGLLKSFGLDPFRRVSELSNGQRGQLALTLVLAQDPDLLILDDPMLGLDAVVRHEFMTTLADLLSDERRAVLFSSHILSDVERLADRIVILADGEVRASGALAELQSAVQLVHVTGSDLFESIATLPGILSLKKRGRGLDVVTTEPHRLAIAGISFEPQEPLSLEDIFIALTATVPVIAVPKVTT